MRNPWEQHVEYVTEQVRLWFQNTQSIWLNRELAFIADARYLAQRLETRAKGAILHSLVKGTIFYIIMEDALSEVEWDELATYFHEKGEIR
jgi:hypothetical protein